MRLMRPNKSGFRLRETPGRYLMMKMSSTLTLETSDKRRLEGPMDMAMEFRIMIFLLIISRVVLVIHMVKAHTCLYMKK
jgi:hypothetical protein